MTRAQGSPSGPNVPQEASGVDIVGDWGTSRLRLWLRQDGTVVERREGPGIAALSASPEETLMGLIEAWRGAGPQQVFLCGMVGSRLGWKEAPYVACPVRPHHLGTAAVRFEVDGLPIRILPGISCINPLGAGDVMRGEEIQVLGALTLEKTLRMGRQLLALPGTHNKWAVIDDGVIVTFLTAPLGELFALLVHGSTLIGAGSATADLSMEWFHQGLDRIADKGSGRLVHLLFEARSRQLLEGISPPHAQAYLSGLLVAADAASAFDWFGRPETVHIVGAPRLTDLYMRAFAKLGVSASALDGDNAVLAGLAAIARL